MNISISRSYIAAVVGRMWIIVVSIYFEGEILAVYIFICFICTVFWIKRTRSEYRCVKCLLIIIFFIYLYFVIKLTQFPILQTENMEAVLGENIRNNINMIPFRRILNITSLYNIILTVPVGLLIPALNEKAMSMKYKILMILLPGLLIEGGQLMQMVVIGYTLRIIDIDDIICNSAGVCAGYVIFCILQVMTKRVSNLKIIKFLNRGQVK